MEVDSASPPSPTVSLDARGAPRPPQPDAVQAHAAADHENEHEHEDHEQSPDRRPKKSSSTCTTCRARKVRCDGARTVCSNCQRLGFPCSYDDADPNAWTATLPRRRVKQACLACHSRKARCSGHVPSCERCRAQGIQCVYRPGKRARTSKFSADRRSPVSQDGDRDRDDAHNDSDPNLTDPVSISTPSGQNFDIPGLDESFTSVVGRTFEKFFRHVHHIPMFSFLHRASLTEQYHAGKVDKPLLLALVGITSCLTDMGPGLREYGNRCIDDAEAILFSDYTRPSTIKVQALVLMIKHRTLSKNFPSAFMLLSIASRYATALRLNYEAPQLCFLAQESRRRLMWALYCIDSTISGGYPDFSLWTADRIHVTLPCNERNFEFDLPQPTEKLIPDFDDAPVSHAEDVGSLALHIRILHIRRKIVEFTKSVLVSRNISSTELQTRSLELHKELDDFASHLPASFQFSDNSLRLRAYSPRICVFIMIHVWWRQCHCDLYRLGLAGLREALPRAALANIDPAFLEHCQRQCFDHSMAMAHIFSSMQKLNAKPVTDLDLAICAYQCARMLAYSYYNNADKFELTAEVVLDQAKICLQAIKQCCFGGAAAGIRSDLENMIAQGLTARKTNTETATPDTHTNPHPAEFHQNIFSAPVQRTMGAMNNSTGTGTGTGTGTPTAFPSPHPEAPSLALTHKPQPSFLPAPELPMTDAPFSSSMMMDTWGPEPHMTPEMPQPLPADMSMSRSKSAGPDMSTQNSDFTQSELNNAYEGAFEGLGLDSGLDYAMGLDLNITMPTTDWVRPDYLQSTAGV
ncbi:fungal-specific transcription factor domain-containing protein [Stachybotrys elegans]|uniref:Fungal-specific transcription factor domain-containing protein n=1 Tax=Stachybotrys elegans TaxID=80388 RepID=A0A8K0SUF3_9HYPO|nr:fungal-specific transcription factor domain-containing protein [Stachybotrys elegans]